MSVFHACTAWTVSACDPSIQLDQNPIPNSAKSFFTHSSRVFLPFLYHLLHQLQNFYSWNPIIMILLLNVTKPPQSALSYHICSTFNSVNFQLCLWNIVSRRILKHRCLIISWECGYSLTPSPKKQESTCHPLWGSRHPDTPGHSELTYWCQSVVWTSLCIEYYSPANCCSVNWWWHYSFHDWATIWVVNYIPNWCSKRLQHIANQCRTTAVL